MEKSKTLIKRILIILVLIVFISTFGDAFSYWDSTSVNTQVSIPIGIWDTGDTELEVSTFLSTHAFVLSLTEETVTIDDKESVETALFDYGLLSEAAKAQLIEEETLLLNLLYEIIALENSEYLDFEAHPYDSGLTGTVEMNGRTWYGNDVFIANDPSYDVWNDTRSLALRSTAYFESQDYFINGIDKISIYFGALNFDNGTSYQFKVEYELASNPGVWVTLQENGSDLLIDVTSATPLSSTEIDVNITEASNIRFTPVISTTTDYINLDDIRIYEHIVSSDLEVTTYQAIYAGALELSVATVEISDQTIVEQALVAYDLLSLEAQTALTAEKALLDSLLVEINIHLSNIASFPIDYADALALTVQTVTPSDKTIVEAALTAYTAFTEDVQNALSTEKALLDSLLVEINSQIPTETLVAQFISDHATALALTTETVTPSDQAIVDAALAIYETLTIDAQNALLTEKALLDSLLVEIYLQIDILEAEALVIVAESSNLQADVDAAQVLVTALPSSTEKTALQARLDAVQDIIDVEAISQTIIDYFASNTVVVRRLNSTSLKEEAFLLELDNLVTDPDVTITITNTNEIDRRNTTYTLEITKNGATITIDVDVDFTR
jgi:hypothetical protein